MTEQASLETAARGAYRVQRVPLAEVPPDIEREWRDFLAGWPEADIVHEIDWLRREWSDDLHRLFAILAYEGSKIISVVSYVVKSWPLTLRLGELQVLELPLQRLCLISRLALPEDPDLYEAVFREIAGTEGYDALFFEMVERDSFLHRFLPENAFLSGRFRRYSEGGLQQWHRIRFPPTADAYFQKFSSKTRSTQRRKIRKLGNDLPGELVMKRFDAPDGLSEFLTKAIEVSKRSYQWHLLGKGLRNEDKFRREVTEAAKLGWLRAYLLNVGERSVAFMLGYQYNGIYHYKEVGFDQELRKYSPGTVLQVMVIDDLYAHDTPRTFEFGIHGEQKAAFGNEVTEAESVFMVKRNIYPEFAAGTNKVWYRTSDLVIEGLDRLGVKRKVKQLVRRLSVPTEDASKQPRDL